MPETQAGLRPVCLATPVRYVMKQDTSRRTKHLVKKRVPRFVGCLTPALLPENVRITDMRSAALSPRPAFIALGDSWRLQLSGTCEFWPKLTVEEAPDPRASGGHRSAPHLSNGTILTAGNATYVARVLKLHGDIAGFGLREWRHR
jgi:hypothetical protein